MNCGDFLPHNLKQNEKGPENSNLQLKLILIREICNGWRLQSVKKNSTDFMKEKSHTPSPPQAHSNEAWLTAFVLLFFKDRISLFIKYTKGHASIKISQTNKLNKTRGYIYFHSKTYFKS